MREVNLLEDVSVQKILSAIVFMRDRPNRLTERDPPFGT